MLVASVGICMPMGMLLNQPLLYGAIIQASLLGDSKLSIAKQNHVHFAGHRVSLTLPKEPPNPVLWDFQRY
jgi:hypothetical protein